MNTSDSSIILGDEEPTIEPTAPLEYAVESAYPEGPLLESQPSQPPTNDMQAESQGKADGEYIFLPIGSFVTLNRSAVESREAIIQRN